ncbi:MAG: hypothetical protein IPO00_13110 [Betaproteobacteria bacterium]|nr:hypothetical protein [Betaproteobacteria bacterium]
MKTNQFLKWGCKAQGDFGTLPPCRFTISKRGQWVLTMWPENKSAANQTAACLTGEQNFATPP